MANANRNGSKGSGQPPASKSTDLKCEGAVITVEVPIADTQQVQIGHVDMALDAQQRYGLRLLFDGLQSQSIRLRNGRFVNSQNEALKYVLEAIAEGFCDGKEGD